MCLDSSAAHMLQDLMSSCMDMGLRSLDLHDFKSAFSELEMHTSSVCENSSAKANLGEWNSKSIPIVLCSFTNHFIILGIIYSFGIYQQYYVLHTRLGNPSLVAVIGAINVGCLSGLGIPAGRLAERFGFRTMSLVGTTIMALGLILASFSTELWHFVLTQGLITGIGSSIAYFPAVTAPSYYFDKYRGLAVGLAVSGSGLGGFVISIVLEKLLDALGLQWTLRVCAIFASIVLFASSWFLRIPDSEALKPKSPFPTKLFKDPAFLLLAMMPSFAAFGYLVPIVYSPLYATTKLGTSSADGALSAALFNAASTLGRIAIGSLADLFIGRLNAFILCIFLSGLSIMVIWPLATSFGILLFFTITNGFLCGGIISLPPAVMADIYGVEGLASMLGVLYTAFTLGNVFGAPLAGFLLTQFTTLEGTNWIPAIECAGSVHIFACFFGIAAKVIYDRRVNR